MGRVGNSSYIGFEFSDHDADVINLGDQIWSNGHEVEIEENIDAEDLDEIINTVSNKQAFKCALRRMEFSI